MPAGEGLHEKGREGVRRAKRWLESTIRFQVPVTSLDLPQMESFLSVPQLAGLEAVGMDMFGNHYTSSGDFRAQFFAEVKHYGSAPDLKEHYHAFLAKAYGAERCWESIGDLKPTEWLFITWHPVGATTNYANLTTPDELKSACDNHSDRVPEEEWDPATAVNLSERLWFLLASPRLEDMLPDKKIVSDMLAALSLEETQ